MGEFYKEVDLKSLPTPKVEERKEGDGEGSWKGRDGWDAKTLVRGDDGSGDDETLRWGGDDDEGEDFGRCRQF